MRSKVAQSLLDRTPKDLQIFTSLCTDLVVRINEILKQQGISKKELAEKLDKHPSEISKWLNGEHNFTLGSIAKLSAELGVPLLEVPRAKETTMRVVKPIQQEHYGGDYKTDTVVFQLPQLASEVNETQQRYGS